MATRNKIPVFRQPVNRLRPWRYDRRTMTRDDFNRLVSAFYLDSSKSDGPYYGAASDYEFYFETRFVSTNQVLNRGLSTSINSTIYRGGIPSVGDLSSGLTAGASLLQNPVETSVVPFVDAAPITILTDWEKTAFAPDRDRIVLSGQSVGDSSLKMTACIRRIGGPLPGAMRFNVWNGTDFETYRTIGIPSGRIRQTQAISPATTSATTVINGAVFTDTIALAAGYPDYNPAGVNSFGTNLYVGQPEDETGHVIHGQSVCPRAITEAEAIEATTSHMTGDIEVYLVAGQSNACGRGTSASLPDADRFGFAETPFYYGTPTGLDTLEGMYLYMAPGSGNTSHTQFGPEIYLAKDLQSARPSPIIAVIKHAESGTAISLWEPVAGASYARFKSTVDDGLASLAATFPGQTITVKGFIWDQGEADIGTVGSPVPGGQSALYESRLTALIAGVRSDYGAGISTAFRRISTGQDTLDPTNRTTVRAAQDAVAAADSNSAVIDSDAFSFTVGDTIHLDATGQTSNGEAFAAAIGGLL